MSTTKAERQFETIEQIVSDLNIGDTRYERLMDEVRELRDLYETEIASVNSLLIRQQNGISIEKLNLPETAPKDGMPILADVGLPWLVMATWNSYNSEWAYADFQACEMKEGGTDTYFETDWSKEINGWLPVPQAQKKADTD